MRLLITILFITILGTEVMGQNSKREEVLARREANTHETYYNSIRKNQQVLTGKNYYNFYPVTEGHQFLDLKIYDTTSIVFDGILYDDIVLNYDIYSDEVIISTKFGNEFHYLILDKTRISQFHLAGKKFVYFEDSQDGKMKSGIYELAFRGKQILAIKHVKDRYKLAETTYSKNRFRFRDQNRYYLIDESGVKTISGKKDLIASVYDPEKASDYIKKSKLKLNPKKGNLDIKLIMVLEYLENSSE